MSTRKSKTKVEKMNQIKHKKRLSDLYNGGEINASYFLINMINYRIIDYTNNVSYTSWSCVTLSKS